MKVRLFVPCFVDHFAVEAAWAAARVLHRVGCEVVVPEDQTCCGQAAANAGYHEESREVASRWLDAFAGADAVVGLSGSCVAFVRESFPALFEGTAQGRDADEVVPRCFELSQFLVDELGVEDLGARLPGRAVVHDGCHGLRGLGLHDPARRLLRRVEGLELVEAERADLCCGFGGSFAVKLPELSVAMADEKLAHLTAGGCELVVSTEPTCLAHLEGRARRRGLPLRTMHLAQVLDSVPGRRP